MEYFSLFILSLSRPVKMTYHTTLSLFKMLGSSQQLIYKSRVNAQTKIPGFCWIFIKFIFKNRVGVGVYSTASLNILTKRAPTVHFHILIDKYRTGIFGDDWFLFSFVDGAAREFV